MTADRDAAGDCRVAVVGTAGVPAAYGGFETLAENLVRFNDRTAGRVDLTVYCSSVARADRPARFDGANLAYVHLPPNGIASIAYDVASISHAVRTGHGTILLLGVSGAVCLPLVRLFCRTRILTNIDGIEWKRAKWSRLARLVLRWSEWFAVRFSHVVITDNAAIAEYVAKTYKAPCEVIAYGGDHALEPRLGPAETSPYGAGYALALCRIEPENNVQMILEAYAGRAERLVFVGNWANSEYGRSLAARYGNVGNIEIVDPVYEPHALKRIRSGASLYVHGHSAGGTNPSLVEMMQFGIPVAAFDCAFNRHTTEGQALYFKSAAELQEIIGSLDVDHATSIGEKMRAIGAERYTWSAIGQAYIDLFLKRSSHI